MPRSVLAVVFVVVVGMLAFRVIRHGRGGAAQSGVQSAIVTPAAAQQVLASVWAKRELARTNDDTRGLAAVDTGPELARDMSLTVEAHDGGYWSQRVQRPLTSLALYVPFQTSFPASFLAVVQTTSQWSRSLATHTPEGRDAALLVLSKTSASAPWRVAMETHYSGTISESGAGLDLDAQGTSDGYARPAPQPGWIRPVDSIAMLASFYQHYAQSGEAPNASPFLTSPWTTEQGEKIAADGLNGKVGSQGFRNYVTYNSDAAADGVYQFDVGGMNLTCGTVRGQATATAAAPGGYLYQPKNRSNWGGWLAPGDYSRINSALMHQVCLLIAPTSLGGIRAISGDDEDSALSATGTPLSRFPSPATPRQAE
jgi:hypothetical protein